MALIEAIDPFVMQLVIVPFFVIGLGVLAAYYTKIVFIGPIVTYILNLIYNFLDYKYFYPDQALNMKYIFSWSVIFPLGSFIMSAALLVVIQHKNKSNTGEVKWTEKINTSSLIVGLYCFPFVYLSMLQDYNEGSMIGYLFMVVATSVLAFFCGYTKNNFAPIIGNIAAIIFSYYLILEIEKYSDWGYYFKPLTTMQLLFFVSVLNLIPQVLAMKFARKIKLNRKE